MEDKIFDFIVDYALRYGYLPTYREIGEGVGLKSTSSIAYYMVILSDKGKIEQITDKRYRVSGLRYRYDS